MLIKRYEDMQIKSRTDLSYWEKRKNSIYLRYVDHITCTLAAETKSLIDVGSRECPYLDWFPWVDDRVSLDLNRPYRGPGVRSIKTDFLTWAPDKRYDVVLCLQVLEHIPPVKDFAKKLLEIGNHVIVSVPYKWPETAMQGHVHDPIDREKFDSWFPYAPDYFFVAHEPLARGPGGARIVAYFDTVNPGKNTIFRKRDAQRGIMAQREPVSFTAPQAAQAPQAAPVREESPAARRQRRRMARRKRAAALEPSVVA